MPRLRHVPGLVLLVPAGRGCVVSGRGPAVQSETLAALRRCPMCADELAETLGITANAAQLRLWKLRQRGLVVEWDRVAPAGVVGRRRVVFAPAQQVAS